MMIIWVTNGNIAAIQIDFPGHFTRTAKFHLVNNTHSQAHPQTFNNILSGYVISTLLRYTPTTLRLHKTPSYATYQQHSQIIQ